MNSPIPLLVLAGLFCSRLLGADAASPGAAKAGSPAADRARVRVEPPGKEYVYKQSNGKPRTLVVYSPEGWQPAGQKVPGVILFHGGNWSGGSLDQFRYACHYFASRGLVAATVNYQLAVKPDANDPAGGVTRKRPCITDAKSAIRWMKQHAAELGVDPKRIITGGGSAGGHVSVLAVLNSGLNDPGDPQDFDTSVVACLLFNPAFDVKDREDTEVDVLKHLQHGLPPAIFFFGTNDSWRPGADALRAQLQGPGNQDTELWLAEGQGHGFFNTAPWQDVTLAEADRFLVRRGLLQGPATLAAPPAGEKLVKAP